MTIAEKAYIETHENAPPEVPAWNQLHRIEREYLEKFTKAVIWIYLYGEKTTKDEDKKETISQG